MFKCKLRKLVNEGMMTGMTSWIIYCLHIVPVDMILLSVHPSSSCMEEKLVYLLSLVERSRIW